MKESLEQLQQYTWGDDPKTLKPIDDAIIASHGDVEKRKQIEDALIGVLKSDASRNGKDYVCRKLKVIGTDASVPVLAEMLGNKDHSHMARFALQSIPTAAASKALVDSLSSISGELKAGVLGSLGARGDNSAVLAIANSVGDSDLVVATAAAKALGAIRSAEAAKALAGVKPAEGVADAVMDATLCCAEGILASGDKAAARAIYQKLLTNSAKHIKLAATRGMLACAGS